MMESDVRTKKVSIWCFVHQGAGMRCSYFSVSSGSGWKTGERGLKIDPEMCWDCPLISIYLDGM